MDLSEKIRAAIEESLKSNGLNLVRVRIIGGSSCCVSIDIERVDDLPVTIDDCVGANRLISVILDVEDFIKNKYTLEVGSIGDNRPLLKISDFERFCGRDAKVEVDSPINGKKKISGKIVRVEQNAKDYVVYFKEECNTAGGELELPYSCIKKASVKRF